MFHHFIPGATPVPDAPQGQFVITRGVAALGIDAQLELTRRVAAFDGFIVDIDPHVWHEMGVIEFDGTTVWFKLELYDVDLRAGLERLVRPHSGPLSGRPIARLSPQM